MNGFYNIQRSFRASALYRQASCAQREVFFYLIEKVQFNSNTVFFGGKQIILQEGDIWVSRSQAVRDLAAFGVKDSTVRNVLKKWVNRGYILLVKSSKTNGSIYRCLDRFYNEISPKIESKQVTNNRPTIDQQVTNNRPRIDQQKGLTNNELHQQVTNNRPTIDQQVTNNRPRIDHKEEKRKINKKKKPSTTILGGKVDFDLKNESAKDVKKVALKKENYPVLAEVVEDVSWGNPLENWFEKEENKNHFLELYPLLDVSGAFEDIKKTLMAKATNGNGQINNPYSYVMKSLENKEKERQQRVLAQKQQLKNTKTVKNGNERIIDNTKFAAASGGNSPFVRVHQ